MMTNCCRIAPEEKYNGEVETNRPRSTPPEPPPRRRYLQRPAEPDGVETTPQYGDARRPPLDHPPSNEPRGLGPRWPSSPALGAHAQTRPATSGLDVEPSPLFLRRVVIAGDDYDDVIDDVSAYGLKRSK